MNRKQVLIALIALAAAIGVAVGSVMFMSPDKKATPKAEPLAVITTAGVPAKPEPPKLPDISGFTIEKISEGVPALKKGVVQVRQMKGLLGLKEFLETDGRIQNARLSQMQVVPQALYIQSGDYDMPTLYDEVQAIQPDALLRNGKTYTVRLPLLVEKGASLTIRGEDVDELRLSQDRSVMLSNTGLLYIIGTKVTGWNEAKKKPSVFESKTKPRPFIISWSGAHMHLLGSTFSHLGYNKGKSYGISYSHCEGCVAEDPRLKRATGTVIGNTFLHMYYGFYCYEADDVAIIGNTYKDNIIYAIDPHDRSHRLIIAKNETFGTKEKHGIIVSREVNDSWIFDNHTHHNKGSGIMIDRTSVNNVIANNLSEHNEQDGLTFFESQNNTTWGNRFMNNGRNGIKARNSWDLRLHNDTIVGNRGAPVDIYTADITGQETRDFQLDPYTQRGGAVMSGATIKSNPTGVFKLGQVEELKLWDLFITPSTTPLFLGNRIPANLLLLQELDKNTLTVHVLPASQDKIQGKLLGQLKATE